jgi:hypothetical protein
MAEIRRDFSRTAEDLARVGRDAGYVAIGLGVVGFQKAQVARRDLMAQLASRRGELAGPLGDARSELHRACRHLDKAVGRLVERADAGLEPIAERLPSQAQAALKQARATRDKMRSRIAERLAA